VAPALVGLAAGAAALASPALAANAARSAAPGVPQSAGLSVQGELRGVTAISSASAWAVGDTTTMSDKPILARWNGAKWSVLKSRALPALGQLFGVAKFPGGAWAAGFAGGSDAAAQPLILRLAGATASRAKVPSVHGGLLLAVTATSAKNAWAVGQVARDGQALILHWNGRAWGRMTLPGDSRGTVLNGVAATSARNAWAIGSTRQGDPLIVRWNGRRWRRAAFPAPGGTALQLRGLTATSAVNAWAVGWTGGITNTATTVILHWNGKTWRRTPSQNPTGGSDGDGFLGAAASSARDAWAAGTGFEGLDGTLMIQHWGGTSWKAVATPAEHGTLYGVAIGGSRQAWAVGQTLAPSEAEGVQTLILRWNGAAWH
jgi:hypothetical protein